MDIALCYESIFPAKGGAETYIATLARRLIADGHRVQVYAARWDPAALAPGLEMHAVPAPAGPRFLRPWRFARACEQALSQRRHDVTVGFDKTYGQDVLYPQGGLHAASRAHNRRKAGTRVARWLAAGTQRFDLASHSFAALERRQYLGPDRPLIVANSEMVRGHFQTYLGIPADQVRVVHAAVDRARLAAANPTACRATERAAWGEPDDVPVGLMVAMNYRLKGLAPLIRAVARLADAPSFRVVVVGHPNFTRYARLAERLGVTDRFLFRGFRADPRDAYHGADFLIHPTFYDPCSLVALEALAAGRPVITTRFNGAAELLGDGGLVVSDPHDAQALSAAIRTLLDAESRAKLTAAATHAASAWTYEQHYAALLAVFQEAAARRAARGARP